MIEFLCPNGHRIRCQAEQAGRAAKCPRCGVKFRVPKPTDLEVSEAAGSDSKILRPEFVDSMGSSRSFPLLGGACKRSPRSSSSVRTGIVCTGRPIFKAGRGECPECGSRFRIPTYEDISAEEEAEKEISLGRVDGREGSDAGKRDVTAPSRPTGWRQPVPPRKAHADRHLGRGAAGQAMAALVARLWDVRPTGATIELRLRDGETIVPHEFLKKLSQQNHQGVFAVKEADGEPVAGRRGLGRRGDGDPPGTQRIAQRAGRVAVGGDSSRRWPSSRPRWPTGSHPYSYTHQRR